MAAASVARNPHSRCPMISAVTEASRAIEAWEVEVKGSRIRSIAVRTIENGELEADGLPSEHRFRFGAACLI